VLKKFILSWGIDTLAVLVAVYILGGRIYYDRPVDLAVASLLLGVLNAVLRPILTLLTLPLVILTLGLFRFVINALLLYLVGYLLQPHFRVDSFKAAFWGALIISIISSVLHVLTGTSNSRGRFQVRRRPPDTGDNGGGPVIDV
jgi:putative membrane protein